MIDFHSHLDLFPNPASIVDECVKRELFVLSVTTTPSAWRGTNALSQSAKKIRTALGIHPQLAAQRQSELPLFDRLISETHYVGEIGLDGSDEFRQSWKAQVSVFEHVLGTCQRVGGRTMSIHSRRAASEVICRLERFSDSGTAVLHWFSGTHRELAKAIEIGCWFSLGPAMLNSKKGREIASRIPANRILTETDGPFAMQAGKSLCPWDVVSAEEALASIWKRPLVETKGILEENLQQLTSSSTA